MDEVAVAPCARLPVRPEVQDVVLVLKASQEQQHTLVQVNALVVVHRFWIPQAVSSGDSFHICNCFTRWVLEKLNVSHYVPVVSDSSIGIH